MTSTYSYCVRHHRSFVSHLCTGRMRLVRFSGPCCELCVQVASGSLRVSGSCGRSTAAMQCRSSTVQHHRSPRTPRQQPFTICLVRSCRLQLSSKSFGVHELGFFDSDVSRTISSSPGLMPTEARGNYLPEAPYLRRQIKTYLNYMHASESTLDIGTSGTASHSS